MAKIRVVRRTGSARRNAAAALVVLGIALASSAANAGLGEPSASIQRDHVALGGSTLTVTPREAYDVHETAVANDLHVRQYVSHAGTVFAVAWAGRTQPDLKTLLARHYDAYIAAASANRGNHHVLAVTTPNMVISIVRHPRGFTGTAYVPASVPAGVSAGELR